MGVSTSAFRETAREVALTEFHIAERLQHVFTTPTFRVFTHHDVLGCELGGALKNVYAVAAGVIEGKEMGDNARATLITRGLAELIDLPTKLGGEPLTFAGLAGHVGRELGKGRTLDEILGELGQVAEGVTASRVVNELAADNNVVMPIARQVYAVCWEGKQREWAQDSLMRPARSRSRGEGRIVPTLTPSRSISLAVSDRSG